MSDLCDTRRIAHVRDPADGLLPAVVVGYRFAGRGFSLPTTNTAERGWAYLEHQAGGHACTQHAVLGLVLRFAANIEHARRPPDRFFRAFTLLSDDPWAGPLHREFPDLTPLQTSGAVYGSSELELLHSFTDQYFSLPPALLDSLTEEAFVELRGNPLEWFAGWRIWTSAEEATGCIEYANIAQLTCNEATQLTPEALYHLEHDLYPLLHRSNPDTPNESQPHIYLLWENSD